MFQQLVLYNIPDIIALLLHQKRQQKNSLSTTTVPKKETIGYPRLCGILSIYSTLLTSYYVIEY